MKFETLDIYIHTKKNQNMRKYKEYQIHLSIYYYSMLLTKLSSYFIRSWLTGILKSEF